MATILDCAGLDCKLLKGRDCILEHFYYWEIALEFVGLLSYVTSFDPYCCLVKLIQLLALITNKHFKAEETEALERSRP